MKYLLAAKYVFREFVLSNLILTGVCEFSLLSYGYRGFIYLFWIKLVGFLVVFGLYYHRKKQKLYFFHNLGLDLPEILILIVVLDSIVTIPLLSSTIHLIS